MLNINYLTPDLFNPTLQMPGFRGPFGHTLVSHRNPGAGNTAEIGFQALGALTFLGCVIATYT